MNRRMFLAGAAGANLLVDTAAMPSRVIDTHVHFYDPRRPQGVPWPPKEDAVLYRPVLPQDFRQLTKTLNISGVIEVEASPLLEDNQWVLDLAEKETIILGTVGNIQPGTPDFTRHLERFHRNRRFRGIREGNLWNRDLGEELGHPQVIADLKLLAQFGLEMDTANPNPALLRTILKLTDLVPNLRIVIDHLPIDEPAADTLRELAQRPQVFVKVSNIVRRGKNSAAYRPALDELWDLFGENRLFYGSNWPVSDLIAPYNTVFKAAHEYFAAKGREACEKYFWRNAVTAYGLA